MLISIQMAKSHFGSEIPVWGNQNNATSHFLGNTPKTVLKIQNRLIDTTTNRALNFFWPQFIIWPLVGILKVWTKSEMMRSFRYISGILTYIYISYHEALAWNPNLTSDVFYVLFLSFVFHALLFFIQSSSNELKLKYALKNAKKQKFRFLSPVFANLFSSWSALAERMSGGPWATWSWPATVYLPSRVPSTSGTIPSVQGTIYLRYYT